MVRAFGDSHWIWYPAGDPRADAPEGSCFFRRQVALPDRPVVRASFVLTADNHATLWVNGEVAGATDDSSEGWRHPVTIDVRPFLRAGDNTLAIRATNAPGGGSNPAGVIGALVVEFSDREPLSVALDRTWKSAADAPPDWATPGADDSGWVPAKELAGYGAAPWGRVGAGALTLSPVHADPFDGEVEIGEPLGPPDNRLYLVFDAPAPEAACRVEVDGRYAGGAVGRPFRLDLTDLLKPGRHHIRIEPFAPAHVRVEVFAE